MYNDLSCKPNCYMFVYVYMGTQMHRAWNEVYDQHLTLSKHLTLGFDVLFDLIFDLFCRQCLHVQPVNLVSDNFCICQNK